MVLIIMSYNFGIISGVRSNQLQEGEKKKKTRTQLSVKIGAD